MTTATAKVGALKVSALTDEDFMDEDFMNEALTEARRASAKGEVPVGAIAVREGKIIARGHNLRESELDPTAHAEMRAITKASEKLNAWRLTGVTLYVTLEPCLMCMGAILQARLPKLVYAASDPKAGACGSLYDVSNDKRLNHRVDVTRGTCQSEASMLLKNFFNGLRDRPGRRPPEADGKATPRTA